MKNYQEIIELINTKKEKEEYLKQLNSLFYLCKNFNWKYQINEKVNSIKPVIQCYMDEEDLITHNKRKKNQVKKSINETSMVDKIYAEIYTKVYDKYYKGDKSWNDAISDDKVIDKISEHFSKAGVLPKHMKQAIKLVYNDDRDLYKINLDSLHKAMNVLSDALNTPEPSIKESVDAVIMEETLEELYSFIEYDNKVGLLFEIAPIRRALKSGAYKSYYRNEKSHKQHYFNLECEYNYDELSSYIEALYELQEEYTNTMNLFKNVNI